MKATKITYQRCFNLGDYENEVIGVEVEIEEGEKFKDVLDNARKCVEKMSKKQMNEEVTSIHYECDESTIQIYEEQESESNAYKEIEKYL